jgi:anti-sigma factor RsiW
MSAAELPAGADELHAYVDGQLDPERIAAVEAHLAADPEAARLVAAYRGQRKALRAAFPAVAEPVPPALDVARLARGRDAAPARTGRAAWRVAAGFAVAFLAGTAGGWALRNTTPAAGPVGIPALAQEAVVNHVVYAAEHGGRAVEMHAAQQADLVRWLSARLHRPLILPDLADKGFRFMGGRLVATDRGPAALLMYDDDRGTRVTVFTRPMTEPRETRTVPISRDGARGYAWVCDGLGYAVVADGQASGLNDLAASVRRQVDPS